MCVCVCVCVQVRVPERERVCGKDRVCLPGCVLKRESVCKRRRRTCVYVCKSVKMCVRVIKCKNVCACH